ncbi:MAG: hypothetical protein U0746_03460 [Gemmataceae bacterium]
MRKRRLLSFESKHQPLLSPTEFAARLARNFGFATGLITVSLAVGMCGYHYIEGLAWIDAFAGAAMILSGMGPLGDLHTSGGKLFAGFYALYSGLLLIVVAGILFAPLIHRIMHRFHLESDDGKGR